MRLFLLSLLMFAGMGGCRKEGETVAVRGRISHGGQALTGGVVTFFPAAGRACGASAPRGEYAIELPPGNYTIVIEAGNELPPGFKEGDPLPPPKVVLPDQYTSRAKSTLKAAIEGGPSQVLNFDLK